jgi:anti-sigma B factor antagonist
MKMENPDGIRGSSAAAVASRRKKALKLDLRAQNVGSVVVHCEGRIVFGPELRVLTTLVADVSPAVSRIIVDLAQVESVDSAGLGELVLLHMWAEAAGHSLKFAGPCSRVRSLLELTNLASVFDIHETVADATAAMCSEEVCSA